LATQPRGFVPSPWVVFKGIKAEVVNRPIENFELSDLTFKSFTLIQARIMERVAVADEEVAFLQMVYGVMEAHPCARVPKAHGPWYCQRRVGLCARRLPRRGYR
jgi:hypothetical protein